MLAMAMARHLAGLVDGLDLNEVDSGGNVFIGRMPPEPDVALAVTPTGGAQQPTARPTNLPRLQIRTRGVKHDPVGPFRMLQQVIDLLACLDGVHLDPDGPDEVWVIGCDPIQSEPAPLGADDNGRHEFTANFELRTHRPTVHRPALA